MTQEWVARYNSPHSETDRFRGMTLDNFGNAYLTGVNTDSVNGNDIITVKINSSGQIVWSKVYNSGGPGSNDIGQAIAVDESGNVYVTGYTGLNVGPFDYITIKYDNNGNEKWVRIYDSGEGNDIPNSIKTDEIGNIYVSGGAGINNTRTVTIKYSTVGDSIWVRKYMGGGNNIGKKVAVDLLGYIYVSGTVHFNHYDYYIIKYDSSGSVQWINTNDLGGDCSLGDIFIDSLGNGAVTGGAAISSYSDCYVVRFNSSGNTLWQKFYNGLGNFIDYGTSVAIDNSGNTFMTGVCWNISEDYVTIKYNLQGDSVWTRIYNGSAESYDESYSICLDSFGNCYVTGFSYNTASNDDYVTIKYDSSGVRKWLVTYNGPANGGDGAGSVILGNNNTVYVGGESDGVGTGKDLAVVKYDQLVGIIKNVNELPTNYKLYQNYPNPFNPSTKIKFQVPTPLNSPFGKGGTAKPGGFVKLTIYDILGREVAVLVNQELKSGTYEVEWSAVGGGENYSSGVYFYRLTASDYSETKKMVMLK